MGEKMTCPGRTAQGRRPDQNKDEWSTDRWGRDGTIWVWGPVPRTCSYCACVHPEDVDALIAAGWTVQRSDKGYKCYMYPPGHIAAQAEYLMNAQAGVDPIVAMKNFPKEPTPPVKLYDWHFSKEDWERL